MMKKKQLFPPAAFSKEMLNNKTKAQEIYHVNQFLVENFQEKKERKKKNPDFRRSQKFPII